MEWRGWVSTVPGGNKRLDLERGLRVERRQLPFDVVALGIELLQLQVGGTEDVGKGGRRMPGQQEQQQQAQPLPHDQSLAPGLASAGNAASMTTEYPRRSLR